MREIIPYGFVKTIEIRLTFFALTWVDCSLRMGQSPPRLNYGPGTVPILLRLAEEYFLHSVEADDADKLDRSAVEDEENCEPYFADQ